MSSATPVHYLTIILFSSGIVAIGANEVHQRYLRGDFLNSQTKISSQSLIKGLRDQKDFSSQQKSRARVFPGSAEKATREKKAGRDSLSRSDRKELDNLLEKVGNE